MSGTYQSKLETEQEEVDLQHSNNLNTCISSNNEEDVAAGCSNIVKDGPSAGREGNLLQLQIQEAIAATISRASQISMTATEPQANSDNSSTTGVTAENEVLENMEPTANRNSNEASTKKQMLVEVEQEKTSSENVSNRSHNTMVDSETTCKENLEIIESSNTERSFTSITDESNHSDDNMGISIESTKKIDNTVAEQEAISSHNENDFGTKSAVSSAESENVAEDVLQIEHNIESKEPIEDSMACGDKTSSASNDIENSKDIQQEINATQIVTDITLSESSGGKDFPINLTQITRSSDSAANPTVTIANILQENSNIQEGAEIAKSETSGGKDFPMDLTQTTRSNDSEGNPNVTIANVLQENSDTQEDPEIARSETPGSKDLPMDLTETAQSNDCEEDPSVSIVNSLQENLHVQEDPETAKSETSGNRDCPMAVVTQTSQSNDYEDNSNASIANSRQENLHLQENPKTAKSETSDNKHVLMDCEDNPSVSIANTPQEKVHAQENPETARSETSDNKDSPIAQTTPFNDEDNPSANIANESPENLLIQEDAEIRKSETSDSNRPEDNSNIQEDAELAKSETSGSKDSPTNVTQTTQLNDCENNFSVSTAKSNTLQENLHTQDAEIGKSETSGNKASPVDVTQITQSIDCDRSPSVSTANIPQQNLQNQDDAEISKSETSSSKDSPMDVTQTTQADECEHSPSVSISNKSQENLHTQKEAEISKSETSSSKDSPMDVTQTTQSDDCEHSSSVSISNKSQENLHTQKEAEISKSETSSSKDSPMDVTQTTQSDDCEHSPGVSISNKSQENLHTQKEAEISKSDTSSSKASPTNVTPTTQSNDCEDNPSVSLTNTMQENVHIQEDTEIGKGETSGSKDFPMDVTETTQSDACEDNPSISIANTMPENLNTQKNSEVSKSETSSSKDCPTNETQTTQSNDCEDNPSVSIANIPQENLQTQEDAEISNRDLTEVTKTPNAAPPESDVKVDFDHNNEAVFPVIEIMEEDSGIPEVIDVESEAKKRKQRIMQRRLNQANQPPLSDGGCIEILSDDDEVQEVQTNEKVQELQVPEKVLGVEIEEKVHEVQVQEKVQEVQVQEKNAQNSEKIQPVKVNIVNVPQKHIEGILQEIKMLTSSEYLLFYLKLPSKWDAGKTPGNPDEKLKTKLENNEITIPDKNKHILSAIQASIKKLSKNRVRKIVGKVKNLTVKEYLWLRSNLPTDCINPNLRCLLPHGSDASQTILWLKTHLEENSSSILLKQEVFNQYQTFCKQNNMHINSASKFGKLIRQVFPKLGQKRLRAKGNSAYYYTGIQPRFTLDRPSLPKLSEKLQKDPLAIENDVECENESDCTSSNNQFDEQQVVQSDLDNSYKTNSEFDEQPISPTDLNNSCKTKQLIFENEPGSDSYRSRQLNGKTILVHDPCALLNMSVNDGKLLNDAYLHQSAPADKRNKLARSSSHFQHQEAGAKYPWRSRKSTSVINNSVRKVKFKEYKHPSVQKVYTEFNRIVLPPEVFRLNINPSVTLNNSRMNNWFVRRLKRFTRKLSNLVIKTSCSQNSDVRYNCCNDTFEVSDSYANQLHNIKEKLSNLVVRKSENSANYEVLRILPNYVLSQEPSKLRNVTVPIIKQLTSHSNPAASATVYKREHEHPSVQRLSKKFKSMVLPEDILKSDIDPVVVLDSGEVIDWYIKQLDCLKQKLPDDPNVITSSASHLELQATSIIQTTSLRQNEGEIMNFSEIDSSEYDSDNVNMEEYRSVAFEEKSIDIVQTDIENAAVSVSPAFVNVNVPTKIEVDEPEYIYTTIQNENVPQQSPTTRKRLILYDEDANENEQKRKKFYCSKITISPNCKASITEQPLGTNLEETPLFQEKSLSPVSDKVEVFECRLCHLVFNQKKEFLTHKQNHLFCTTCKRKLKNEEAMRQHLIRHCSLNTIKNRPILKLHRVDSKFSIVEGFNAPASNVIETAVTIYNEEVTARTACTTQIMNSNFCEKDGKMYFRPNIILSNTNLTGESSEVNKTKTNAKQLYKRTYSRLPRCTAVRILNTAANSQIQTSTVPAPSTAVTSETQENTVDHPTQQPPMFELKNTISNNLNKILLSNNVSQPQSPNILYGTLYMNNTSGPSSPSICLNSSFYNPTVTTSGVDCAVNANPSCSNPDLLETPTFMQIVESPNTPMMQYAVPISQNNTLVAFEHQDHSYHQQPKLFHIGNNIPNTNNIVLVSNNVSQVTELQSAAVNTSTNFATPMFDQAATTSATETTNFVLNSAETATSSNNPPMQGQFRIRVKSIQELR